MLEFVTQAWFFPHPQPGHVSSPGILGCHYVPPSHPLLLVFIRRLKHQRDNLRDLRPVLPGSVLARWARWEERQAGSGSSCVTLGTFPHWARFLIY